MAGVTFFAFSSPSEDLPPSVVEEVLRQREGRGLDLTLRYLEHDLAASVAGVEALVGLADLVER